MPLSPNWLLLISTPDTGGFWTKYRGEMERSKVAAILPHTCLRAFAWWRVVFNYFDPNQLLPIFRTLSCSFRQLPLLFILNVNLCFFAECCRSKLVLCGTLIISGTISVKTPFVGIVLAIWKMHCSELNMSLTQKFRMSDEIVWAVTFRCINPD